MIKACFALMCEEERVYALNFEISGGRSASCVSQPIGIKEGEEWLDYLWKIKGQRRESRRNQRSGAIVEVRRRVSRMRAVIRLMLGFNVVREKEILGILIKIKEKEKREEIKLRMFYVMCI